MAVLAIGSWAIPTSARAAVDDIRVYNRWDHNYTIDWGLYHTINNLILLRTSGTDATASGATIENYTELYGSDGLVVSQKFTQNGPFSIFASVDEGKTISNLKVNNAGRLVRIDLSQTKGTTFYNKAKPTTGGADWTQQLNPFKYEPDGDIPPGVVTSTTSTNGWTSIGGTPSELSKEKREGQVYGTFLLGNESTLINMGQILRITDNYSDVNDPTTFPTDAYSRVVDHYFVAGRDTSLDDMLSLGDSSYLYNGLRPLDNEGNYELNTLARITEQKIKMGAKGHLINAGKIGKVTCSSATVCQPAVEVAIEMGDTAYLENATTPHSVLSEYEPKPYPDQDQYRDSVPYIKATTIKMGSGSSIVNNWGGEIYVSGERKDPESETNKSRYGITMAGEGNTILNGTDFSIVMDEDIDPEDPTKIKQTANRATYMVVKGDIQMGDRATVENVSNEVGTWSGTNNSDYSSVAAILFGLPSSEGSEAHFSVGIDSTIYNYGGWIRSWKLDNPDGRADSNIQFGGVAKTWLTVGSGTKIYNHSFYNVQDDGVTTTEKRVLATIQVERLLGAEHDYAASDYDPADYAANVYIENTGYLRTTTFKLGNKATIINDVALSSDGTQRTPGRIRADTKGGIFLGNSSRILNKGNIITPILIMGRGSWLEMQSEDPVALASPRIFGTDDSTSYTDIIPIENLTSDVFTELTMGQSSVVKTNAVLYAKGVLGGDSVVYLTADKDNEEGITRTDHLFADPNWGVKQGGTFYGSLRQADDDSSESIWIYSTAKDTAYTKVGGWEEDPTLRIEVGTIQVDKGTIELAGNVSGDVILNGANTVVRLTGQNLNFSGAILKTANASNTVLHVKTPDFDETAETPVWTEYVSTNPLNVDTVYLSDGGIFTLASNTNVSVGEYLLGTNGTLKLNVVPNYSGDITRFEDAYNTTLHLNLASRSQVFLPAGKIDVDELIVQGGTFRVTGGHDNVQVTNLQLGQANLEVLNGANLSVNTLTPLVNAVNKQGKVVVRNAKLTVRSTGRVFPTEEDPNNTVGSHFNQLILDSGTFVFKGNPVNLSTLNISNNVEVGKGSIFEVKGKTQIQIDGTNVVKNLDIKKGGQFSLRTLESSDTPANLKLVANLILRTGSNTVLKATGIQVDEIDYVDHRGSILVENNARIFVKNPIPNKEYKIISTAYADQWLNTEAEVESFLKSSFLYIDPQFDLRFEGDKGNLYFTMRGFNDLRTALWPVVTDENDRSMLVAMDQIHKSLAETEDYPPWLERILDSSTAQEAAEYVIEMDPDVHTNLVKSAQQLNRTMTRQLSSLLHDIHTKSISFRNAPQGYYRSSDYGYYNYGRSGGDTYYRYRGRYYPYMPYGHEAPAYAVYSENGSVRSDSGAVWVKPFANKYDQDDIGGIAGYRLKNMGVMGGADIDFDELTLGIMGMYNQGDYKGNDSLFKADIDSYAFGLYGSYQPDESKVFFDFYATYMNSSQDTTQRLSEGNITADYDTKTISGGLSVSYPVEFARYFAVVPSAGVDYARVDPDDFQEKSTTEGIGVKRVKTKTLQSLQSALSARLLANFKVKSLQITPEVFGKWSHEFKDTAASASVAFIDYPAYAFNIKGKDADKQLYTLGASLTLVADESDRLFFTYAYDFNDTVTGHTFELGYLYSF